jgi:hypothetical protein
VVVWRCGGGGAQAPRVPGGLCEAGPCFFWGRAALLRCLAHGLESLSQWWCGGVEGEWRSHTHCVCCRYGALYSHATVCILLQVKCAVLTHSLRILQVWCAVQLFLHLVVHCLLLALLLYVSRLLFVQAGNGSSLYLHRHPHLRWHLRWHLTWDLHRPEPASAVAPASEHLNLHCHLHWHQNGWLVPWCRCQCSCEAGAPISSLRPPLLVAAGQPGLAARVSQAPAPHSTLLRRITPFLERLRRKARPWF